MLGLLDAIVAPAMKFVPTSVTGTTAPCPPLDGVMKDRVGVGTTTVADGFSATAMWLLAAPMDVKDQDIATGPGATGPL